MYARLTSKFVAHTLLSLPSPSSPFSHLAPSLFSSSRPTRHSGKNRVHNCDVHSFVVSVSSGSEADAPSPSSTPASSPAVTAAAAPSMLGGARHMGAPLAGGMAPLSGGRSGGTRPPQVEAYLTGQGLALACATGMPLPAVARVNRAIRRFSSGDGLGLTEKQFSALLGRCELGAQETRWLYCALDREGGGRVASGDLLLALMAFYSGEGGADAPGGAGARVGLMDLRVRYQREVRRGEKGMDMRSLFVSLCVVVAVVVVGVVFCCCCLFWLSVLVEMCVVRIVSLDVCRLALVSSRVSVPRAVCVLGWVGLCVFRVSCA